eukprot:Skav226603  [mRNA]  locus=scaffold848:67740:68048:+ [translate_table: standard]
MGCLMSKEGIATPRPYQQLYHDEGHPPCPYGQVGPGNGDAHGGAANGNGDGRACGMEQWQENGGRMAIAAAGGLAVGAGAVFAADQAGDFAEGAVEDMDDFA